MAVKVMNPRIILYGLCFTLVSLASTARAEEPAFDDSTIPGDVAAYIELKDLGRLRQPDQRNALVKTLLEHFTGSAEDGGTELARIISKEMKLTPDQLFEAYLSKRVVMVVGPGKEAPVMLFMQVTPADVRRVIQYFELTERWQVGPWKAYLSYDKQTLVGLSRDSLFLCNVADEAYAKQVVTGRTQKDSLASNANYQKWLKRLPERDARVAVGYGQSPDAFHYAWQVSITKHKVEADAVTSMPAGEDAVPLHFEPKASTLSMLPSDAGVRLQVGGPRNLHDLIYKLTDLTTNKKINKNALRGVVAWAGVKDGRAYGAMAFEWESPETAKQITPGLQKIVMMWGLSNIAANRQTTTMKPDQYKGHSWFTIHVDEFNSLTDFQPLRELTITAGQVGHTFLMTTSVKAHKEAIDRVLAHEQINRKTPRQDEQKPPTKSAFLMIVSQGKPFHVLLEQWKTWLVFVRDQKGVTEHAKARINMTRDLLTKLGSFDLSLDSKKWAEEQGLSLHITLSDREKPHQTEDSR